ncbi:hypothetical protein J3B00_004212 [Pseudomonas sp. BP8]|nr:hypothetical protein [Pseudomonas sp. BP8]
MGLVGWGLIHLMWWVFWPLPPLRGGTFFLEKVTKNRLLHHTALRCATGPLAPVLLREDRAVRPILGLSAFRPSMASTSLRKTSTRPPEVAGRSRARSRSKARATAGESLRSRFVYLPADLWGGWQGCALRFALAVPASSRGKPAPTGIAQILNSALYRPFRGACRIAAPPLLQDLHTCLALHQSGQRQANRCALALFIYQRISGVAGRAAPCDLRCQYRPLRGTSPLLQGLRKF